MSRPNRPAASGAGWFPDPYGGNQLRWWDGQRWGDQYQPLAFEQRTVPGAPNQYPVVYNNSVTVLAPKSVGLAFALAFFFGPLGLLYATVTGGLVMLAVNFVAFFFSFFLLGIPSLFAWIGCIVWACVAADGHNKRLQAAYHRW